MLQPPYGIDCCKGVFFVIDIFIGDQVIGKAVVEQQGLYYRFACRCRLSGQVMYKLIATCNGNETDLGVCIPYGNCFGLETRCPVKKLGTGEIRIRAVPRHKELDKVFVPLCPEEPFSYLSRLCDAYLETRDGITGVVFPKGLEE